MKNQGVRGAFINRTFTTFGESCACWSPVTIVYRIFHGSSLRNAGIVPVAVTIETGHLAETRLHFAAKQDGLNGKQAILHRLPKRRQAAQAVS